MVWEVRALGDCQAGGSHSNAGVGTGAEGRGDKVGGEKVAGPRQGELEQDLEPAAWGHGYRRDLGAKEGGTRCQN